MAPKKPPRRTAERILEVTLELFNRYGEPNVSTTLISSELHISPGNLYYHYPAKDELVNVLFARYAKALDELLASAGDVRDVEDGWLFFHMLLQLIWQYRFLYRDLDDLVSRNRTLETGFPPLLARKSRAVAAVVDGLSGAGGIRVERREADAVAAAMVVTLTYWLSYEYVRDPRRALESAGAGASLARGAYHVLALLVPYLDAAAREHLHGLADRYLAQGEDAWRPGPDSPATTRHTSTTRRS